MAKMVSSWWFKLNLMLGKIGSFSPNIWVEHVQKSQKKTLKPPSKCGKTYAGTSCCFFSPLLPRPRSGNGWCRPAPSGLTVFSRPGRGRDGLSQTWDRGPVLKPTKWAPKTSYKPPCLCNLPTFTIQINQM